MTRRIVNVVGARPNFMKVAPVHRALVRRADVSPLIVHTGQHYDHAMSDVFFSELGLPAPDVSLEVGSGTHATQTAMVMTRFEEYVLAARPDAVAVYGDVNSTVAAALVCAKLGIPVAHVEAGLRSHDRAMPEEINRVVTDHIADRLLLTEPTARVNLLAEGIPEQRMIHTGNVMIDSLVEMMQRHGIKRNQSAAAGALVTLHRPSNVDNPERFRFLLEFINRLSLEMPVTFAVHPRTRTKLQDSVMVEAMGPRVTVVDPLGYRAFVQALAGSALMVTDSGGVQEESAYLGVPCLTLRANTERPITVDAGTNLLEPNVSGSLLDAALMLCSAQYPAPGDNSVLIAAKWDGASGERIADALCALVAS